MKIHKMIVEVEPWVFDNFRTEFRVRMTYWDGVKRNVEVIRILDESDLDSNFDRVFEVVKREIKFNLTKEVTK